MTQMRIKDRLFAFEKRRFKTSIKKKLTLYLFKYYRFLFHRNQIQIIFHCAIIQAGFNNLSA